MSPWHLCASRSSEKSRQPTQVTSICFVCAAGTKWTPNSRSTRLNRRNFLQWCLSITRLQGTTRRTVPQVCMVLISRAAESQFRMRPTQPDFRCTTDDIDTSRSVMSRKRWLSQGGSLRSFVRVARSSLARSPSYGADSRTFGSKSTGGSSLMQTRAGLNSRGFEFEPALAGYGAGAGLRAAAQQAVGPDGRLSYAQPARRSTPCALGRRGKRPASLSPQ